MNLRDGEAKIIIVSGKARSGKDKTASILKENFEKMSKKVIILQYSSYIKEYVRHISDWDGSDETKPREMLQFVGTELIRKQIDEEFFIKRMIDDIKVYSYFFDVIIISDARIDKEIEKLKNSFRDVVSINVVRPNFESDLTKEQKAHLTETGLLGYTKFDYEIINDGELAMLENKVIDLMRNCVISGDTN